MTNILDRIYQIIWGMPMLVLILGIGIYLSIATGFVQLRFFRRALGAFFGQRDTDSSGVTGMQALCTALASTVGTGNLIGVAGAICIGGPGAVFWMWVSAFFGMAVKFAEAALAVRYRVPSGDGFLGGPMYMIRCALPRRWQFLASIYALLGIGACFGIGSTVQVSAVKEGIRSLPVIGEHIPGLVIGAFLALCAGYITLGGAGRIGRSSQILVPAAGAVYLLLCLGVLTARRGCLPGVFRSIFYGAFCPRAVTGGFVGSVYQALRTGISRGIFSNEAGMGTAGMAHASARVKHPGQQGLMGIVEVFLDTFLVCTLSALVILCSGVNIPYGIDQGAAVAYGAFASVYGTLGRILVTAFLTCFAFGTILGWGLYGSRCARFLFGSRGEKTFLYTQILVILLGSEMRTASLWRIAEILNGLMAVPNLIALTALSQELIRLTKDFETGGVPATGGTYADFHQCQPL